MTVEERGLSDVVWTPERGIRESPEIRSISWNNFLLSDEPYFGRSRTAADIRITPDTAIASTVVLACCRILAETISTLPVNVMRRTKNGGSEIADIPLQKVLSFAPNEWQTKFEFFEQIVMFLTLWGNSYTLIRSGRYGAVSSLDNLHPSRMDVERIENGRLRYLYTNPETGRLERYTQDQIMHIRWTAEPDGIKGMVPVEVAREAIALARACEIHASKYWANNARPGVVLQTDHSLSPEAAERLRDNWEALHRGSDRSHRTAVLTNGLKIEPIGFNPEQSQAIDSRRFQSEEIARVYRLPLHLVQGQSGGDNETSGQEFVTYTLMPWLRRIEGAISRSLIYNDDLFFAEFDTRALMRANSNQRAAFYSTMTNLGIYSINDCRKSEGMPPIENGDKHFVAMNLMPLEEAVKQKQDQPPPGGPPPEMPGGVPSLPGVMNGTAPPESPKGKASEKSVSGPKEGDLVSWEDKTGKVSHVMEEGTLDLKSGEKVEVKPGSPVALVVDESGEEHAVELSKLKKPQAVESRRLSPQNQALYDAQEEIVAEKGKWSQADAHYQERNPFAARGISCANCIYFKTGGHCEIVSGSVRPDAVCKLWIIPEEKLSVPEVRSDCGRQDGGRFGAGNDCASEDGGATAAPPAARRDKKWAREEGSYSKSGEELAESSPIRGGEVLEKFEIESVPDFLESIDGIGVGGPSSLEKVVAVGGGVRNGGRITIRGEGDAVTVQSLLPIASDGSNTKGDAFVEVSMWKNGEGGFNVTYENFFPSPPRDAGEEEQETEFFNRGQVASVMMQKMLESMSAAEKLGADKMETYAAGAKRYMLKGYRLWPQFGFDGDLMETSQAAIAGDKNLPSSLRQKAKSRTLTIQQLIATREGQNWWDENGRSQSLSLNLKDKSSLGYKRYKKMLKLLPRLKSRNESESRSVEEWVVEFRSFCDSERRDCGRDSDGKFGSGNKCQEEGTGGASPATPVSRTPFDVEKLLEKISQNPDGFTLDPESAEQPDSGIMVSEFQNDSRRSVKIPADSLQTNSGRNSFALWLTDNVDVLIGQSGSRYIGGWATGGDFYIDVATRFEAKDAEKALEAGRKAGQLAVFNLSTFKETWVKYDQGDKRKPSDWDVAYAKARKDSAVKQVYDPGSPDMADEDHADELAKTGKKTVRAYDSQDTETGASNDRISEEVRYPGVGSEVDRRLQGVSELRREEGEVVGADARPVVVRGFSDPATPPVRRPAGSSLEGVDEGHQAPGQGSAGPSSAPCIELIADASARAGMPVEDFVVHEIGPTLAAFDPSQAVVLVSPSADFTEDDGWYSQPNPVLREAAVRMYSLASPDSYAAASAIRFSPEQRNLISTSVSKVAAASGVDFIAEVLAGEMCGKKYGHDILDLVASVAKGRVISESP